MVANLQRQVNVNVFDIMNLMERYNELRDSIGYLPDADTNTKESLVAMINELLLYIDNNEYILSAVPFIEIAENGDGYIFTFTRDILVRDERKYEYKTITKQSIKYIYDGKENIQEIIE